MIVQNKYSASELLEQQAIMDSQSDTNEWPIVLAYQQARTILAAHAAGAAAVDVSLDLGLSTTVIPLLAEAASFSANLTLDYADLVTIAEHEEGCYLIQAPATPGSSGTIERIGQFSEELQRYYSLYPTATAPTILIAGFSMHRIKGTDPLHDTQMKVQAAAPLRGRVLDTSTGLGYTAIAAARVAAVSAVVTIELDPTTLQIARTNPWSRELFTSPKIEQCIGDSYALVPTFPDGSFSQIIHDPPIFSLAGELYSGVFYGELFRILRRGGKLFHYIGNLESKGSGGVARGAIRRLQAAGFTRIERHQEAFGVVATKPR